MSKEKQKSILILDEFNSLNLGEMARVISSVDSIRSIEPNVKIDILSSTPETDRPRYRKSNIFVLQRPWFKDTSKIGTFFYFLGVGTLLLFWTTLLTAIGKRGQRNGYKLCLHLTGDVFNDRGLAVLFYHLYHLIFGLVAGEKTVVYAESIGPFKSKVTAFITRVILNRVNLITVREKMSKRYIEEIGVSNKNVILTGDPAFLLKAANVSLPRASGELILGVTPNPDIVPYLSDRFAQGYEEKYQKYADLLAQEIDNFIATYNVTVFLISHVLRPDSDDIRMNETIFNKIEHKTNVRLLRDYYTADEVKGIISSCDIFMGSRMHATIAATSSGVPTVALGHAHKFEGVLGDIVGQEALIDIRGRDYNYIQSRLHLALMYTWQNRVAIRKALNENLIGKQKIAMANAKLTVTLMNSK